MKNNTNNKNENFNIGIAQISCQAGDLAGNTEKIINSIKQFEQSSMDLIIFPKFVLQGCELNKFILRYPFFVNNLKKYLNNISNKISKTTVLISFSDFDEANNVVEKFALLKSNKVEILEQNKFILNNMNFKIYSEKYSNYSDTDLMIIQDESISRPNSKTQRNKKFSTLAKKYNCPIIFVNKVGAIDNLSFEGASFALNSSGEAFAMLKSFEEQLLCINPLCEKGEIFEKIVNDFENDKFSLDYEPDLERTYKSILQSVKSYFSAFGLKRAVLGLSGGLDSTVCATILSEALGKDNVLGVSMPSKITSGESKSDAKTLAENLGIKFIELPIKNEVETISYDLNKAFEEIAKSWEGRYKCSYTMDNIQARSRATFLWCISNEFASCIPIATSDKSEAYMGYATINGDMTGGYAPIADVTKTKLFALARWLNKNLERKNLIPTSIIEKRPGAELAINPKTGKPLCAEEALMPYEFLDEIIWRIENKNETYEIMLNSEFEYEKMNNISKQEKQEWLEKFYNRMSKALYKWSIMPCAPIIDAHSINSYEYKQPISSSKIVYKDF
ncbi:MAG: NAD(+) synthase [bacterium]|nr:NAD(+) synthase [bacterium]